MKILTKKEYAEMSSAQAEEVKQHIKDGWSFFRFTDADSAIMTKEEGRLIKLIRRRQYE